MGAVQEAADLARVYLHSVGMGVPEWAQRTFGNPAVANQTDAQVAQSRANTGLAGDVAHAAGYLAPFLGGIKAIRALPSIARAIPTAVEAGTSAMSGLGAGATSAEVAARLGIPVSLGARVAAIPTQISRVAGSALADVGNAAGRVATYPFVHPIKSALYSAAVGLPALADYAARNGSADATTPSAPAASAPAGSKATNQYDAIPSKSASTNPTFSDLAAKVAASQGGKLSLHDLSTLADVAYKTSPRQLVRQNVTAADMASQQALKEGNAYWDTRMKNAKSKEEADQIFAAKMANLHEIGKASPYDPLGSMNYQSPDGN